MIHPTVDALDYLTGFFLTPGQAHDLQGTDALWSAIRVATVIADQGDDAPDRVIQLLE